MKKERKEKKARGKKVERNKKSRWDGNGRKRKYGWKAKEIVVLN